MPHRHRLDEAVARMLRRSPPSTVTTRAALHERDSTAGRRYGESPARLTVADPERGPPSLRRDPDMTNLKCRAAVLWAVDEPWKVQEIEVEPPQGARCSSRWKAAGLCHSDEHLVTGDMVPPPETLALMGIDSLFPIIGGHEGAGIIEAVGPGGALGAARRPRRRPASCRRAVAAATARPGGGTCATPAPERSAAA